METDKNLIELKKLRMNEIVGFEVPEAKGETIRIRTAFKSKRIEQNISGIVISSKRNFALKIVDGVQSLERVEIGSWVSVEPEDFLEFGGNIDVIDKMFYFDINCYRIKIVDGPDITKSASVWSLHDYRIHREKKKMFDDLKNRMEAF
jgi:hypothetical protein